MSGDCTDPCAKCEEMMQPYVDGALSDEEISEAKEHLARCQYCAKRYRFEVTLRHFVRQSVVIEPMPPELKKRLLALRTPLVSD